MLHADCESRPDVGSSRKSRRRGYTDVRSSAVTRKSSETDLSSKLHTNGRALLDLHIAGPDGGIAVFVEATDLETLVDAKTPRQRHS